VIRKPLCLIFLFFLIAMPTLVQGWFDDQTHGRPFFTRKVITPTSSGTLAVFDDIACGSERVLMQPNPFFVPVDIVDLDISLPLLVTTPVSSMEALDRLMAANLRLKLLIEEYNALKKRAEQLLKSVSIPYLDSPWMTFKVKGDNNLDDRRKDLDTRMAGVLFDVPGGSKSQFSPGGLSPFGSAGRTPGAAGSPLLPPKASMPGQNFDIAPSTHEFIPMVPGGGSKDLPWIFATFFKAGSYCLAHRLEALIYGTILFFLGYLITLQVRHGK